MTGGAGGAAEVPGEEEEGMAGCLRLGMVGGNQKIGKKLKVCCLKSQKKKRRKRRVSNGRKAPVP